MFRWGIRSRLIVTFTTLFILILSLLGSYILWYYQRQNVEILTANLRSQGGIIANLLKEHIINGNKKTVLDERIKEITSNMDLRITVIAADGTVLADSWENPALMENHAARPEVAAALGGQSASVTRYSTTEAQNMLYVSLPLNSGPYAGGVVRAAAALAQVEAGFAKIRQAIIAALILACILAIMLSVKLARKLTEPLEEITALAEQFAEGRLNRRVHIRTGDEVELLAHTLNNLASRLDDKVNEITREKRKLELILRHMDNAVILFDRYGRVIASNEKSNVLFGIKPHMLGQHNIQVLGNSLLDRAVRETLDRHENRLLDLKTNLHGHKRVFQVFLAPISDENETTGVLSVFNDITALQEIHERQTEFVANASHELATPLTAIKGFAETLLDGALDDAELREKFVRVIYAEAERMHRLVQDLLQLAKLDSIEYRKHVRSEPIEIRPVVNAVVREMASLAERKNIAVKVGFPADNISVLANPDWLKQVLMNLLDNAIKYTPPSGSVLISWKRDNNTAAISVQDTGIGIPAQDLPLIFDRFYRVDRARSRTAGGTGLGLAIVKFMVEMLGGKIQVQSKVDAGSTFTVTLPLAP